MFARRILPLALLAGCPSPSETDPSPEEPLAEVPASAAARLSGIVSADGAPVAGAFVALTPHGYEAVTDADGAFELPRVQPGTYAVSARGGSAGRATIAAVTLADGDHQDLLIALAVDGDQRDGRIDVGVVGPDGEALPGAVVVATVDAVEVARGTTDDTGFLALSGLGGLTVDVEVRLTDDSLWSWSRADVAVPTLGATWLDATLAGKPSEDAYYLGSGACISCHPDHVALNDLTKHRHATGSVTGDFLAAFQSGRTVTLGAARAALSMSGPTPRVTLTDVHGTQQSFNVLGQIGAGSAVPVVEIDEQLYPLPFAWVAEDPYRPGYVAEPLVAYQTDRWFDATGKFALTAVDPAPEASADRNCLPCHTGGWEAAARSDGGVTLTPVGNDAGWGRFTDSGVQCETCHGPGSSHIGPADPAGKRRRITNPRDLDLSRRDDVCAQCHGAVVGDQGFPFAWTAAGGRYQPGEDLQSLVSREPDLWPTGHARRPNATSDEFAESAHGTPDGWRMSCIDCHAAHGEGDASAQLVVEHRDNALCLSCHQGRDFEGKLDVAVAHTGHPIYEPTGPFEVGRCTSCHMTPTSALVAWDPHTGSGDVASHRFAALTPQDTLDVFSSATRMQLGDFPANACSECHGYNGWLWDNAYGALFPAPHGDPTLRATHDAYQAAFVEKFE